MENLVLFLFLFLSHSWVGDRLWRGECAPQVDEIVHPGGSPFSLFDAFPLKGLENPVWEVAFGPCLFDGEKTQQQSITK